MVDKKLNIRSIIIWIWVNITSKRIAMLGNLGTLGAFIFLIYSTMQTSDQIKQTSDQIKQTSDQIKQTSDQIKQTSDQISLQKESIPAHFNIEYTEATNYDDKIFITNNGGIKLLDIKIDNEIYFIEANGNVLSLKGMQNKLKKDTTFLEKFKKINLLTHPSGFNGLFNFDLREEKIDSLESGERHRLGFITRLISNNIERINEINIQVFYSWKIRYITPLSRELIEVKEYAWINVDNRDRSTFESYENLKHIIGGANIIIKIDKFEEESREHIFGIVKTKE